MYSAPAPLLQSYWQHFKPQLEEGGFKTFDEFSNSVLARDADQVEHMASYLRETMYPNMDPEEFETRAGMKEWRDEQPTWLEVVGSKIANRTMDLGAGALTTVDAAARWLEEKIPLGGLDLDKGEWVSGDELSERWKEGEDTTFEIASQEVRNSMLEYGYEDRVSWEEFKDSPITQFVPFALEHGLASLPDMAAAVVNLPGYVLARTGEIATERRENEGAAEPYGIDDDPGLDGATVEDLLYSAPTAVAVSILERIGAAKVFGITDKIKDATVKEIMKAGGRRALAESATEAVQEPVEGVGEGVGTKRWEQMSSGEIAEDLMQRSAQGAVVGLGFGGAVGTGAAGVQAARGRTQTAETEAQPKTAEQIRDENIQTLDEAADAKRVRPDPTAEAMQDQTVETTVPPVGPEQTAPAVSAEAVQGPGTAPAAPTTTEPGGEAMVDQTVDLEPTIDTGAWTPPPDAVRSVESMTLEEEAKLGKRHVVTPEALQPGDVVTVDDGQTPPETGTVETADGRLVRVVDEAGSPIAVVRPDAPAETDPVMYTATPESDPELDGALQEIGRLVKRTQDDPQDKGALDALRKIRNGPEFQKLPEESRDLIDDHLRDSDRAVAAAEEAAKEEKAAEKTREKERQAAMDAELTAARERIEQLEAANREEEARLEQEAADRERREQESIARDKERREASERIAAQEDQTVETEAPVEAESEVITPAGRRVKVAPEVVEASSLVTSHDEAGTVNPAYPQEVQPRDRSRTASQVQIAEMAGDITPELLMPSPQASEGAPIIGPDDVVESGNARSLALLKAYREGGADAYRKALEDAGYDVAGMDAPVLVQRRTQEMTPEERAEFAREANARTTADRGAAEVAASDAAGLGTDILAAYRGGQITEAGNRDFVRRFIEGVVPTSERAAMTTAGGELSQQGVQRIENAMFMSAYEDAEILGQLREETDTNIRAIGYAMIEAAPEWAAMRDASEEGSIDPEADVTPHLLDAVNTVRKSRNEGTPIAMLVGQQEMFSGEAMHPLAESMLATMYRDPGDWKKPLGRERMAAALKKIAEEAQKTTPGPDMFGEYTDVEGLLATGRRAAMEGLKGEEETQIDAFGGPGAPIPGQTEQPAGEGGAQPPDGEAEAGGREGDAPEGAGDAGTGVEVKEHAPDGAIDRLSGQIADQIMRGRKLDNPALFRMADEAFGGTVGDGVYDPQDAYHAVELAMNRRIDETDLTNMTPKEVARFAKELTDATELLPTQTRRTAEKQEFQQFSTPPAYAVAANWAAGIREGDQVLEPSAGVGGLAVVARSMGADVTVNEISEKRAENLRILGFDPTMEDAEQIANIMEPESFDVVVMNPPFSAAGKRGVATSNRIGARHVSQAVKMLKPGGRLVAIMGEGFTPENSTVTPAFREMNAEGQIQAIVKVDGRIYRKYGTTFDNQLIVFDKTGEPGNPEAIQRAEYDNIPDLITALEPIHDSRPVAEDGDRGAIRPAGEPGTGLPGDVVVPGEVAQPGTGAGAARPGSRDRPADGRPVIAPVREGADEATLGGGGQGAGPDAGTVAEPGPSDRPGRDEQRGGQGVEQVAVEAERIQEEEGTAFSAYKPARVKVKGAKQHPAKLVESTAMASVKPPKPAYTPQIDEPTITEGRLSDAQLEQITYAGNAHAKMLPNGRRRGYFIGDGTGVGKGREVSGIILDNWNQGRKKAVWVSKDKKLLTDARRDIAGVGFEGPLLDLTSTAKARKVEGPEGVAFTTYSTLRSAGTKEEKQANVKFPNVQKLAAWLGEDFDGVVAFDEAHVMANLMGSAGARGGRGPSQVAQAGEYLQELLPNARVVYVSATGATEVSNLGYLDRLGLWGEGTAFSGVQDFTAKIGAGGVATMELVARDMKQMGLYGARSISYEGVEYDNVTHDLTEDQALMYDTAARAWQVVFNNINEVMDILMPGASASQQSRAKPMSYFWGANQRFFNQVLTSMQMPSVIESIETDLKEGRAPVLQLTNTNEAATTRAVAALEEGQTLDDIDITPRQVIIDFVDAAFPTTQMQEVEDEFGNIRWEPVVAADGVTVVQNAEAVAMKNQLLAELASLRLPGNPLDMILEHFGTEKVAEITGRSNRVVTGSEGRKEKQPRSHTARLAEIEDFQEGRRDVLVFSAAGGTGASYHADLDATNQKRRSHYVLQAGWKADEAIQGFGRTHRSNEANQPQYRLVQTNLPAHKRFVATIARRLDQLGALTKGQREASATGLFTATDNLENEYAQQAVYQLFNEIKDGEGVMSMTEAYEKMGIAIPTDQPLKIDDIPVHRFLNRLLSLEIEDQNKVFEDFADKLGTNIEAAVEAGEYEVGVETYKAEGAEIQDRQTIHTDEETGAKTEYIQVEVERRNIPVTFGMIQGRQGGFVVNRQSGKVYFMEPAQPRTDPRTGAVTDRVRRHGVNVQQLMPATEFSADKYETIDDVTRAEELWNQAVAELPATRKSTVHMLAGALLPVYDRIESQSKKVQRIILNDGTSLLGRVMSGADAQKTLKNFGKGTQLKAVPASELVSIIRERNASAQLSNGVQIKEATVSGEARLELLGLAYSDALPSGPLARMGFQSEMMNYRQRMFVPNGPDGVAVLDRYLKGKEVVEIVDRHGNDIAGDVKYAMAGRDPKALQKAYGPALRDELEEIAARLAPSVRFETMNKRKLTTAGAVGMYIPGETIGSREVEPLIVVAMQGAPREILRHEAIHALKEQGLFTPAEWSALEHAAETGKWLDKHGIRDRYPGLFREDGSATPAAVEEAIADEFAGWTEGKADAARSVTVRRLFDRIFEFFRDLTARLRGYGVTPRPGSIFDAVERGEVGARPVPARPAGAQAETKFKVEFANPETEKRWQEASKGVKPTAFGRIGEAIREEWRKLTRTYQHLPQTRTFADALEKMNHLAQSEHAAKERIASLFDDVMGGLEAQDVDLLTRKMVLDDLLWSSSEGMDLPFGLKGTGDVLDALHDVETALDARPELMARLERRNQARDELKNAMVGAGVLNQRQARNPHYFRHQVLEYASVRAKGAGKRKVVSTYWHSRRGSEKDINANYFQAEADWMYKAHQDLATARFLNWLRGSQYNQKRELVRRAKADNLDTLNEKIAGELKEGGKSAIADQWGKTGRNIGIAMSKLRADLRKRDEGELRTIIPDALHGQLEAFLAGGGERAATDDGGNSPVFGLIQHLADSSIEGANEKAGIVLATVYNRRKFLRDTLGDAYVNPQDVRGLVKRYLGETHDAWQPDSFDGKTRRVHIFTGKTVAQHVLDRAVDNLSGIVGDVLTEEQVDQVRELLANGRDVRMMGGPMEELVLPQEITATLNEFYDEGVTGAVDALAVMVTGRWKQWVLFNPARFAKYYLNNVTGDMDALLATKAGKGVAKQIPQAFRDVKRMIYNNEISDTLAEALEKGVVQSSLVMQEVTGMGPLADDSFRPQKIKGVLKYPSKYFNQVQNFARLRENAFRYAAYLHYRGEFDAGKSLADIGYGASPPWMVEGITGRHDKAARMARDLLGDYGAIPVRARWARKRVIPFVSWLASNTTRYINLYRNAYLTGRDVSKTKGVAMGAVASAGLMTRMFLLYGAVQLWNNLLFGDEEELLGTEERLRMHAILGRWGGEVVTLRFQGAQSDFLGWLGFEDAGAVISEIQAGRASAADVGRAIAKAPVNKIAQGVTPLYKLPMELLLGQQFYPDVFKPRSIRDRTRHSARTFSLDYPTAQIKKMMGESAPTKSPLKTVASAIVYSRDPGQIAYDNIRGLAFDFINRETGSSIGGRFGGRSQALYNYRVAKRHGDTRSQRLALEELKKYRGSGKSLRASMKRARPLGMFPNKKLRRKFLRTLSPKERDILKRAQLWYRATM